MARSPRGTVDFLCAVLIVGLLAGVAGMACAVALYLLVNHGATTADGWGVAMNRWDVGEEATPRPIGVFELTPPRS